MGNIVGRQNYISNLQAQIIIGSLLGDGRLECRSKSGNARLRMHHGEKQKEYLFWKYDIFKNITTCKPRRITWEDKKRNVCCVSWYFHTLTLKELRDFHLLFYKEGKKVLPSNLYKLLTPLALAVWTMDDGDNSKNSLRYNIQSFNRNEQELIKRILKRKYDINANLNKDRNNYRLRVDLESTQRLIRIIQPFIIPSIKYKICPRND
ncbi:MAG: LAGLIDADG endonuclease [Patescibacteria group bacterium]|nr:LAGLIDADG endonuclease [Patescibacteria group bacterium]